MENNEKKRSETKICWKKSYSKKIEKISKIKKIPKSQLSTCYLFLLYCHPKLRVNSSHMNMLMEVKLEQLPPLSPFLSMSVWSMIFVSVALIFHNSGYTFDFKVWFHRHKK